MLIHLDQSSFINEVYIILDSENIHICSNLLAFEDKTVLVDCMLIIYYLLGHKFSKDGSKQALLNLTQDPEKVKNYGSIC
jgi:hypothetical protein